MKKDKAMNIVSMSTKGKSLPNDVRGKPVQENT
jgi:hypothetical protein